MKIRSNILIFIFILALGIIYSCRKKPPIPSSPILGVSSVDLNANLNIVRNEEALIGNLISDAIYDFTIKKGKTIDFAMVNGGNIRFSSAIRPDGIYKAGNLTNKMADEMLPFGDANVIVSLTGKQLKEVLERSCAQLPQSMGPFLQVSKGIKINIDITKQAQLLNIDETAIVTPGERITSVLIHNTQLDTLSVYKIALPSYIANGFDGYVTLKNLPDNKKENTGENQVLALKEFISINTPVKPQIENRISFQ